MAGCSVLVVLGSAGFDSTSGWSLGNLGRVGLGVGVPGARGTGV